MPGQGTSPHLGSSPTDHGHLVPDPFILRLGGEELWREGYGVLGLPRLPLSSRPCRHREVAATARAVLPCWMCIFRSCGDAMCIKLSIALLAPYRLIQSEMF